MSSTQPITAAEMAAIVRGAVNGDMGTEVADAPHGASFEMTAPATGQRFRVTVAGEPGWSARMDRELAEITTGRQGREEASFDEHARQALDMVRGTDEELLAELGAALRAEKEAAPVAEAGREAWRTRQQRREAGNG